MKDDDTPEGIATYEVFQALKDSPCFRPFLSVTELSGDVSEGYTRQSHEQVALILNGTVLAMGRSHVVRAAFHRLQTTIEARTGVRPQVRIVREIHVTRTIHREFGPELQAPKRGDVA